MTALHKQHSSLTLIPFGLRTSDQRLVDVSQVPKGAGCGCICPSCGTPLIARQGEIKEWHFAHASRGVDRRAIQQCEYSFYLSVSLMAKQLFLDCSRLRLPDYVYLETLHGRWSHRTYRASLTLTRGRRIKPDRCQLDKQLAGHAIDVLCEIAGVPLGIVLERPDKRCGLRAEHFTGHRVGVLKIDLLETLRIFRNMNRAQKAEGFHQALERFLFDRKDHKQWIYYPHQEERIRALTQQLEAQAANEEAADRERRESQRPAPEPAWQSLPGFPPPVGEAETGIPAQADPVEPPRRQSPEPPKSPMAHPPPPASRRPGRPADPVSYECVLCNCTWTGERQGLNPCPQCGSHLYRRELKPGTEGKVWGN